MKKCKHCGGNDHKAIMCLHKPRVKRQTKSINRFGKQAVLWMQTRNEWLQQNPPQSPSWTAQAGWRCHYCKKFITIEELTLDHKYARSGAPELRHDLDNLVPCCYEDNRRKGSIDYDTFCQQYYPHLLEASDDDDDLSVYAIL